MKNDLFSLALQGTLRKWKSSVLIFMVLLLSFSFAILSLSLVDSIQKTNEEFRKDTYGSWYYAISEGRAEDAGQLSAWDWVEEYGSMRSYGTVYTSSTVNGFGTVDAGMVEAGRLMVDQGNWPSKTGEIALEADTLSALGYDYELGQEITLSISVPWGQEDVAVEETFTLCGILHEFSDLWVQSSESGTLPVSAVVTEGTGTQVLEQAEELVTALEGNSPNQPVLQYYIVLTSDAMGDMASRKSAGNQLSAYLTDSREEGAVPAVLTNEAILSSAGEQVQSSLYLWLIALVALAAVLCVYLLHLPDQLHSCATLRSLGMTRPQLFLLALDETLILALPAVALGIPLGIGLTWAGLRLTAASGSAAVVVQVPWLKLTAVILLWLAVAVLSRLVLFFVAAAAPLTGRFQMKRAKSRRLGWLRNVLALIPLCALGVAVFLAGAETAETAGQREYYRTIPHYWINGNREFDWETELSFMNAVPETAKADLLRLPGVKSVTSYSYADVGLSFDGMAERTVQLIVLNEEELDQWDRALELGADWEGFRSGQLVLLCFPSEEVSDSHMYLDFYYQQPGEDLSKREYTLPEGSVTLSFYNEEQGLVTRRTTEAALRYLSYEADRCSHGVELHSAYTVICSGGFLKEALADLAPGQVWTAPYQSNSGMQWVLARYGTGEQFGYRAMDLRADPYGNTTLTDNLVAKYCKENNLSLNNTRLVTMAREQEALQSLILVSAASICVGLMALLVLVGILSLEAEQELRRYSVLRAIGLSKRQMWTQVLGKALGRSLIAVCGGLVLYLGYKLESYIYAAAHPASEYNEPYQMSLGRAWEVLRANWEYYEISAWYLLGLAGICVVIVVMVSLFAKRRLRKEREAA